MNKINENIYEVFRKPHHLQGYSSASVCAICIETSHSIHCFTTAQRAWRYLTASKDGTSLSVMDRVNSRTEWNSPRAGEMLRNKRPSTLSLVECRAFLRARGTYFGTFIDSFRPQPKPAALHLSAMICPNDCSGDDLDARGGMCHNWCEFLCCRRIVFSS